MKKSYNLNSKKVVIMIIISLVCVAFSIWFNIYATIGQRFRAFATEIREDEPLGSVFIFGIIMLLVLIYNLELLIYKRKNILEISENGIVYYAPEYGRMEFLKENIKDIYFVDKGVFTLLKIKLDKEYKKGIRARFWNFLKASFITGIDSKVFRINLAFIKCNKEEIQELINNCCLDAGTDEVKEIINTILKKYNISNINELNQNETALKECVMELYKMETFTQNEISVLTKTSVNKISKIIKNNI